MKFKVIKSGNPRWPYHSLVISTPENKKRGEILRDAKIGVTLVHDVGYYQFVYVSSPLIIPTGHVLVPMWMTDLQDGQEIDLVEIVAKNHRKDKKDDAKETSYSRELFWWMQVHYPGSITKQLSCYSQGMFLDGQLVPILVHGRQTLVRLNNRQSKDKPFIGFPSDLEPHLKDLVSSIASRERFLRLFIVKDCAGLLKVPLLLKIASNYSYSAIDECFVDDLKAAWDDYRDCKGKDVQWSSDIPWLISGSVDPYPPLMRALLDNLKKLHSNLLFILMPVSVNKSMEETELMHPSIVELVKCHLESDRKNRVIMFSDNRIDTEQIPVESSILQLSNAIVDGPGGSNLDCLKGVSPTQLIAFQDMLPVFKGDSQLTFNWLSKTMLRDSSIGTFLPSLNTTIKLSSFPKYFGYEHVKQEIRKVLYLPLDKPNQAQALGLTLPTGILLYGPSGCGKSALIKSIALHGRFRVLSVRITDLFTRYFGDTEQRIRTLFAKARALAPCLVYLDNIEILGSKRSINGDADDTTGAGTRALSSLLNEMDGFEGRTGAIFVACTRNRELLDEALLRPGRFDRHILIDLPNKEDRMALIEGYLEKHTIDLMEEHVKRDIVGVTEGLSCAHVIARVQSHLINKFIE